MFIYTYIYCNIYIICMDINLQLLNLQFLLLLISILNGLFFVGKIAIYF